MRTPQQIAKIQEFESPPVQINNFLSVKQVAELLQLYNESPYTWKKQTGPTVFEINHEGHTTFNDTKIIIPDIINDIVDKLNHTFDNFGKWRLTLFDTFVPHRIHNDDSTRYPNVGKAFTMPLIAYGGNASDTSLIIFNQRYYGGPVKYHPRKNGKTFDKERVLGYNSTLSDPSDIIGYCVDDHITSAAELKLLAHMPPRFTRGLSIQKICPWNIGSVIAFDSLQFHCGANFVDVGINRKIGLSIFTER
jgi:hypothetical protein